MPLPDGSGIGMPPLVPPVIDSSGDVVSPPISPTIVTSTSPAAAVATTPSQPNPPDAAPPAACSSNDPSNSPLAVPVSPKNVMTPTQSPGGIARWLLASPIAVTLDATTAHTSAAATKRRFALDLAAVPPLRMSVTRRRTPGERPMSGRALRGRAGC